MSETNTMTLLNFRTHADAEKEARAWRKDGHRARVEMDMNTSRWTVIVTYAGKPANG